MPDAGETMEYMKDHVPAFMEPPCQQRKWTVIKKINKIISDSDVCYKDNKKDSGRERQQRRYEVEGRGITSLKGQQVN